VVEDSLIDGVESGSQLHEKGPGPRLRSLTGASFALQWVWNSPSR